MRIEMTAGHLADAMKLVGRIVERRNTIPVLGAVKFADSRLIGTNLDMELSVAVPAFTMPDGSAVIDSALLAAIARHVGRDERLCISIADDQATARFNGSEYQMPFYPVGDYPDFGAVDGQASHLGNTGLVAALGRVAFAISTEETRYYLNGAAIVARDGVSHVCATNGHLLAVLPVDGLPDAAAGSIIHSSAVKFLTGIGREPETVIFQREKPRARFDWPGMTLSAKLIDGAFPDIWRVIPQEPTPVFSLDRAVALPVLKRIRAFTRRARQIVRIEGSPSGLVVGAVVDGGSARETLALTEAPAEPFVVGYNIDYLITCLSAFSDDVVTFSAHGGLPGNPALMTCADDPLCIVLMPGRV
jgi:DNA polymerase-3 subunit beta